MQGKMAQSSQPSYQQDRMDSSIRMDALLNVFDPWRQMGQNDQNTHTKNWQLHQEPLEFHHEKENFSSGTKTFAYFILITAKIRIILERVKRPVRKNKTKNVSKIEQLSFYIRGKQRLKVVIIWGRNE